jgi:hypothetical protein
MSVDNLQVYNRPDVAAHYAVLDYLTPFARNSCLVGTSNRVLRFSILVLAEDAPRRTCRAGLPAMSEWTTRLR